MRDWATDLDLGDELAWDPMRLVDPDPWVGHIPFAFWLVKALRPATLVELGAHSGNSYFAFCQAIAALAPMARAYAVDTWQGDEHAGHYAEEVFAAVAAFNDEHFRQFSTLLRTTFDDARGYFPEGAVDLLHIDGMHTYEAVRHDFETWKPALSPRAVVLFHDTNVRERGFGVWRLWQELSASHPSFEFSHSHGLGVLGAGPEQAPAMQALFALSGDPAAAASFRRRVSSRGEAFQRMVQLQGQRQRFQSEAQALQGQLAAAAGQVEGLAGQLGAARRAAEAQQAEIAWRDMLLAGREEIIRAKDALVAEIGDASAARAAALDMRDAIIQSRDAAASHLSLELRNQQQAHVEQLAQAAAQAEDVRQQGLQAADQARRDAEATVAQMQAQVSAALSAYVNSTSWRLTRPVRVASRLLRGRRAAPPPQPPPAVPFPASPAAVAAAAGEDVTATTPLKAAFRTVLQARLQAFLAGPGMLVLPRSGQPEVSVILVLHNQAELTFGCLGSIVETLSGAPFGIETVIVDNASTDQTGALLDRLEGATVLRNAANLHFLKAVNQAARAARGRALLLLNNDAQLLPGALASALRTLDSAPGIGAVGGRIILPNGTLQEAGSIVWRDGACSGYGRGQDPDAPDHMFQRDVDYCSGAFLLTRASAWRELGGFDERYAPAYYEETDYCLRLWQGGWRVVFDPDASIVHYEFGSSPGTSDALALQASNHAVFVAQHRDWLAKQFPASPLNVLAARYARSAALRVLVLEDRVPKVELGSGYPRANRLLQELADAGAQVALFPMNRHPETWHGVRKALDKRVEVLIAAEREQLRGYLVARRGHFDAILVCRPANMETFLAAVGFDRDLIGDATLLYDAEALFVTRALQRRAADGEPATGPERHAMVAEEVALTRMADSVISVAPGELALLERYGARHVHLLGHALEAEPIATPFEERDQVVFLGAIHDDDAPNADAVRWFASDILPTLRRSLGDGLRLTVVGLNKAPSLAAMDGAQLDLVGMVDSLPAALARARVLVVPTRFAAGIPLKAYDAAMLGIPMVVTGLIATQLGWAAGSDVLVADDATGFAEACARLHQDRALWEAVRANALARARRDCSPAAFRATLRGILSGVPLTHRLAEGFTPDPPPVGPPAEPNTSRPQAADYSAAVPFGYLPQPGAPRLGVMCHMFHMAVAPELRRYLRHLPPAELMLTTDTAEKQAALAALFGDWPGGGVEIRVVPNRGRDVAPKLVGLADRYARYDLVLHLHSKVSDHAAFLAPWRSFLFESLLGSEAVVASILDAFGRLPDLGMVAPQHYEAIRRWLGWNGNFDAAKALAARMGISLWPTRALDFPSGSMFWARPAALRPLLDLKLSFEDFPDEGAQVDHTPAHTIERLFFYACERSGHTWLKVAQPALLADATTVVGIPSPTALSRFVAEHGVALSGPAAIARRDDAAALVTRVPPGLASRLAARAP